MYRIIYFGIVMGGLISGCATTDNPQEGGLLGGVYGLTSGAYDNRLEDRRTILDKTKATQQAVQQEQQQLVEEKTQKQQQQEELEVILASLEGESLRLSAQLAKVKANTAAAAKKKVQLNSRIKKVTAEIAQVRHSYAQEQQSLAQVKQSQGQLQHSIEQAKRSSKQQAASMRRDSPPTTAGEGEEKHQQRVQQLKRKAQQLEHEVKQLWEIHNTIQ